MDKFKNENFYSRLDNPKERIQGCFQDYSNDFTALHIHLMSGIENVRDLFEKGYKVKTVQEYLLKVRSEAYTIPILTEEDEQTTIFIENAQKLNDLASRINSLGKNITEQEFVDILDQVKKIIY